jgi:hypothetical protein
MLAASSEATASCDFSSAMKGKPWLSFGTAMYTSLPSSMARARSQSCGESGFIFSTRARAHSGCSTSRRAASSAPT